MRATRVEPVSDAVEPSLLLLGAGEPGNGFVRAETIDRDAQSRHVLRMQRRPPKPNLTPEAANLAGFCFQAEIGPGRLN